MKTIDFINITLIQLKQVPAYKNNIPIETYVLFLYF